MLSADVRRLLDGMSSLMRRLATTTVDEEERSADRIRGPIQWGPTLTAQTATGIRHIYVTAPARRAYDTPENQVLVAALKAIVEVGRRSGWGRLSGKNLGIEVRRRLNEAQQWLSSRALLDIIPRAPTPRTLNRVATGRARRRYQPAVEVVRRHQTMIRRLDPSAIRSAVENHALVTANDDVLFELLCGFEIERVLRGGGWSVSLPGLLPSGRFLTAQRASAHLDIYYQRSPPALGTNALYEQVQRDHKFKRPSPLRPDYVLRVRDGGHDRWIVVEVKGGRKRKVATSARAALGDLLAYRRNYHAQLKDDNGPYGLGIAWGAKLEPVPTSEVLLCSADRIESALQILALA